MDGIRKDQEDAVLVGKPVECRAASEGGRWAVVLLTNGCYLLGSWDGEVGILFADQLRTKAGRVSLLPESERSE